MPNNIVVTYNRKSSIAFKPAIQSRVNYVIKRTSGMINFTAEKHEISNLLVPGASSAQLYVPKTTPLQLPTSRSYAGYLTWFTLFYDNIELLNWQELSFVL